MPADGAAAPAHGAILSTAASSAAPVDVSDPISRQTNYAESLRRAVAKHYALTKPARTGCSASTSWRTWPPCSRSTYTLRCRSCLELGPATTARRRAQHSLWQWARDLCQWARCRRQWTRYRCLFRTSGHIPGIRLRVCRLYGVDKVQFRPCRASIACLRIHEKYC